MVMLAAAEDTFGIPAPRRAAPGRGPNTGSPAARAGEVSPARVEILPAGTHGVDIALRGELGCGDAAVLSRQLHHRLDLVSSDRVPDVITVDA